MIGRISSVRAGAIDVGVAGAKGAGTQYPVDPIVLIALPRESMKCKLPRCWVWMRFREGVDEAVFEQNLVRCRFVRAVEIAGDNDRLIARDVRDAAAHQRGGFDARLGAFMIPMGVEVDDR